MNEIIRQGLIEVAREERTVTYHEIAPLAHLDMENPADRDRIRLLLNEISAWEMHNGRPMLTAVVVHQRDGLPGDGFFTCARNSGVQKDLDNVEFFVEELWRVHEYWNKEEEETGGARLRSSAGMRSVGTDEKRRKIQPMVSTEPSGGGPVSSREESSMPSLPELRCPSCGEIVPAIEFTPTSSGGPPMASSYASCLRKCVPCGIGFSNRQTDQIQQLTHVLQDPFRDLPTFLREGWEEMLSVTLNERSRGTKRERFGFTTSEDHVTWTIFRFLQTRHALRAALAAVGVVPAQKAADEPTTLLWGAPVPATPEGAGLRRRLVEVSDRLKERPQGRSEPDIVLAFERGIVLIEVKHRSENAVEKEGYGGWKRYVRDTDAFELPDQVQKTSGLYELARYWRIGWDLAGGAPMTLVNLGPAPLFAAPEDKARLGAFTRGIRRDASHRFLQVAWTDFLKAIPDPPEWLQRYCRDRHVA
jgi:hypothetical protein